MIKIKKLKPEFILYWVVRAFSAILSLFVVLFLIEALRDGVDTDSFIVFLLFSLLFIVPGVLIFFRPKIAIWIYSVLNIILILSAVSNFYNWSLTIIPIWILFIIILLIIELRAKANK